MSVRTLLAGVAVTALATSGLGLATMTTATADPASTPDANDIVGVGSDTIEDVMDILADGTSTLPGYNAGKSASDPLLVSFKTVGSAQITLRQGADPINRPVGSGAGKALLYGTANNPAVTYARSSSALNTTEQQAGLKAFPFAVDTLKMAVSGNSTNAPASLTPAQVVSIYKGDVTNWSQIDASKSGTIKPYVPQAGSGTRSFFEAQLKAANGGTAVTYGANVDTSMHENTDDVLKNDPNAIAPFSLAKAVTLYPSTVHLEGGAASWDRAVYNVVRGTDTGDAVIQGIFGENGFICSTEARDLIEAAGFKQLATPAHGGACGTPVSETTNFVLNEQVATTTTLAGSSTKAKTATLVATVSASTSPSGSVSFYEGDTELASDIPLVSGAATYTVKNVTPGKHTYTAVFEPGDGSAFDPSTSSAKTVKVKAAATVKESFPATVAKGKKAKGTVTVSGGATGTVKVMEGKKTLASAKLKNGKATFTLKLSKGTHSLKAVYGGSSTVAGASTSFKVKQK